MNFLNCNEKILSGINNLKTENKGIVANDNY